MTPKSHEQTPTSAKRMTSRRLSWFRNRWLLTVLLTLSLAMHLRDLMSEGTFWLGHFPYFDFVALFHRPFGLTSFVSLFMYPFMLAAIWYAVAEYRRDEKKQVQEALLAERHRQMEGVWPPAPTKPE